MKKRWLACLCAVLLMFLCACADKGADDAGAGYNPAEDNTASSAGSDSGAQYDISQLIGWWEVATSAVNGSTGDMDTLLGLGLADDGTMIYEGMNNTYFGYWNFYEDEARLECQYYETQQDLETDSNGYGSTYIVSFLDDGTAEFYNSFHDYTNTYAHVYDYVPDEAYQKFQASQEPQAPEYVFEPDYAPGKAETMSKFTPYGVNKGSGNWHVYPTMVRQDEMLYFVSYSNFLCKIHQGNTAPEDVIYLYDMSGFGHFDDLQIVGDWIYFDYQYSWDSISNSGYSDDKFGIARIRTDGLEMEVLVTDAFGGISGDYPEYVVHDNKLWYVTRTYERVSASELWFDTYLMRMDLETGEAEPMYVAQDCGPGGMNITAYTDETMMLSISNYPKEEKTWVYRFEDESMVESPRYMGNTNYVYHADEDTYYRADSSSGIGGGTRLYSYAPENGFAEEEILYEKGEWWSAIYPYDGFLFVPGDGLRVLENGQFRKINGDEGAVRGFDGEYIYYWCNKMFCRVRLDGSGWEQLHWWDTQIGPTS